MTLRHILAVSFLVACGLPLLVFWLWPLSRALDAELDRTHERHLALAQSTAATLDIYQRKVTATFSSVARGVAEGRDLSFAFDLLKAHAFSHFCIVDARSGAVLDALNVAGNPLPERLPEGLMRELSRRMASPASQLSQIWKGPRGGPGFLLVEDLGEVFVFALLNPSFVQQTADSVVFGQNGHMAVLDAQGRAIAHPNVEWARGIKDLTTIPAIAALYEHDGPKVMVFDSPQFGEDVVAGAAPVGGTGWRVLVPQPVSEVRAAVVEGRVHASLVFLSGLALSAVVAMLSAAIILPPLKSLTRAAETMANGAGRVAVGPISKLAPYETKTLSVAFDKMALRVEATLARESALAREDASTGLLNKRSFEHDAERWLQSDAPPAGGMLLHVDLNNLKRINDIYGHTVGDAAIVCVGRALQGLFPAPSLIGRVGGDEFLVLSTKHQAAGLNDALRPLLEGLVVDVCGGLNTRINVSCSVGAAKVDDSHGDFPLLVLHADEAMYYAKRRGIGFKLHDAEMRSRAQRRTELAAQLRLDVSTDRLEAEFQPVYCAQSGKIVSFEALARWGTRDLGRIAPSEFLTIAQDIGIMSDLDRCVRRKAFVLVRALRARGDIIPVAVNATARDLARGDFIDRFTDDLGHAKLKGEDVIVEVTEAIFHDRYGLAIRSLDTLSEMGVRVHLDDFGKGFSAHGLLPLFSFDAVKIDMRFAGTPMEDKRSAAIIASLSGLGKKLGLTVTLEGIETPAERDFAHRIGANRFQGYFFGKPMPYAQALEAALGQSHIAAE